MHVSSTRFDCDAADEAGIDTFTDWVRHNSEVCSHCFSRVRDIGDETTIHKSVHTHRVNTHYQRADAGSQEYTPFDTNTRYGTCFCTNCGRDTRPDHQDLSWALMKSYAVNLATFIDEHTPLTLDRDRFARELAHQRLDRSETCGRESQIFAVAVARAIGDGPHATADDTTTPLTAD